MTMNGRYYDLFDGFQQASSRSSNTNKNQSPYSINNGGRVNGIGPCAEDYDPTSLLAGTNSSYNSTNPALNNNGVVGTNNGNSNATTIPQYGLYRPSAPCPNPALIQNMQQQVVYQHQQQQQRQQVAQAALIAADYEPVALAPAPNNMQQQTSSSRNHHHSLESLILPMNAVSDTFFSKDFDMSAGMNISADSSNASLNSPPPAWLEELKIEVSGLSLEPLSGAEVMDRLRSKTGDVIKRFLPCVDFLVMCQQELRKGLAVATQKRLIRRAYRDNLTPKQFYQRYIHTLPQRFLMSNRHVMEHNYLRDAFDEIQKLSSQARAVERQGCEAMKNTFLGGMKDGESWGLRKWLSKHGGALQICTDLELILSACQKLDKEKDSTKKLATLMRPLAKNALDRLKKDVPHSYQEVSTAHPYLPFFHRLEAALRGMSNFDPEDDDVICLEDTDDEDDEVQEVKSTPIIKPALSKPAALKRAPSSCNSHERSLKRPRIVEGGSRAFEPVARFAVEANDNDGDDSDSDIEVIGVKPAAKSIPDNDDSDYGEAKESSGWTCSGCTTENVAADVICTGCKMSKDFLNDLMKFPDFEDVMNVKTGLSDTEDDLEPTAFSFSGARSDSSKNSADDFLGTLRGLSDTSPIPLRKVSPTTASYSDAVKLAQDLDSLADVFEIGQQNSIRPRNAPIQPGAFWDGDRYASALRLFSQILRMQESVRFLEPVDVVNSHLNPPYASVIKNPLCFRDIVSSLIPENFNNLDFDSGRSGVLSVEGLSFWNMWLGQDFFQAIDLVLLNTLAYTKISDDVGVRSKERSDTNRVRKTLWNGINGIISQVVGDDKEQQKKHAPTRRGETSGFVILKSRNR